MNRSIRIAIIVMGFSGLIAEIILLRELLIVFSGNELSIGIILANWLILEALGCFYPGRMIDYTQRKMETFAAGTFLFCAALIAAIFATRILKELLGVSIGEHVGLLPMFYSSFLILLPVSVLHGALFTFSCRIYTLHREPDTTVDGRVYVDETLGTMAGGIIFTFVFIPLFNSFEVVIGITLLNMLICLWILSPVWRPPQHQRTIPLLFSLLAVATGTALFTGQGERLNRISIQMQWKEHNVVHYQNSFYSNIVVLESQEQFLFFLDGIPEVITPIPDMLFVEEFVHLPMLAHTLPEEILILRGGAGGMIDEILKHPTVQTVTYAEHDPVFLDVIRKFSTPLTEAELGDPRVRIRYRDGRLLLATSAQTYDLIFIGVKEPSNLQSNRFFTTDFFTLAQERLNEGGILVLTVPGSLTFLSNELKNLNSTIFHSLKEVFPHIRVIPGDHRNLYMASGHPQITDLDMQRLVQRIEQRQIDAEGMVPWHIEKKMHDGWRQWFLDYIEEASDQINRDTQPVGLFYHISHWNSLYAPAFGSIYNRFERIGPTRLLPLLLLPAGFLILSRLRRNRAGAMGVPFCIITTGFAGMIFSLILIFMFQITYGHVFSWIGLLVAFFMAGAAAGAVLLNRILPHILHAKRWFLAIELAIITFSLLLPFKFQVFFPLLECTAAFVFFRIFFLILSLLAGLLIGMQFPLANHLHLTKDPTQPVSHGQVTRTGGLLYALDLLGGWMGGVAAGVVLLPVMGVTGTCMTVVLLKLSSFFITATEGQSQVPSSPRHY